MDRYFDLIYFASGVLILWVLVFFIPILLVVHYGLVRAEERYLEEQFGDRYREYRAHVRRYL